MDIILKSIVKQSVPYLAMGMVSGFALTFFYGFLIALMLNTAIWVTIPYITRNYVKRSAGASGFAQEKYLVSLESSLQEELICLSLAFEFDSLSTSSNCRPYLFRSTEGGKTKKTWECIIRMLPNNKSGVEESSKMIAAERIL